MIIEKKYNFNIENTLSNIRIPIELEDDFDYIKINLSYNPNNVPKELTRHLVDKCLNDYIAKYVHDKSVEDILLNKRDDIIIENLITVNLFYEGKYVGGWHNKSNNQNIFISQNEATLGFSKMQIKKGYWEIRLSLHSVNSPVQVDLKINIDKEEVV